MITMRDFVFTHDRRGKFETVENGFLMTIIIQKMIPIS